MLKKASWAVKIQILVFKLLNYIELAILNGGARVIYGVHELK